MHATRRTVWRCAIALALVPAALGTLIPAHAGTVYKCRSANGSVAYQDHACADPQNETLMQLTDAPAYAPSPEYGTANAPSRTRAPRDSARRGQASREAMSYECRAGNGEVFYAHTSCPKSIMVGPSRTRKVNVSAVPLPRSEACARLAASGGRAGNRHDAKISTYERNIGRDPCR